ncbi:MAG: tRNA (guanine-N1)-methyltransferase [candidate division Zixibacteria bacterium SM23_73]|nr:MAG: tRNA (guanine-N1)-methyltransferase [candidate division Zixibacteria bacterium SM23_73]
MQIDILTIFPNMFSGSLNESLIKKAQEKNLVKIRVCDIRNFAEDKHRTVDDTPFGGGGGMVMKLEPLCKALESVWDEREDKNQIPGHRLRASLILTTPQGERFSQEKAKELSLKECLVIICGHYKGVDERLGKLYPLEEISIGDYVLTGGEIPALIILDAVVRLIPGVLGDFESAQADSFYDEILGPPQYTRPAEFRGLKVPEVLLSGDHEEIRLWRKKEALKRTLQRRPDLVNWNELSQEEKKMLEQIKREEK